MNAQDVETYLAEEQGDQQRPIQTLARAYAALCTGTPPWVSLNEFFHEWFDYSSEPRELLIADPIPFSPVLDQLRWAAVCAGIADYLCRRFGISQPTWIDDTRFVLDESWYGFGDPEAAHPAVRVHLERVTPEPLRRRNVFAGNRLFANKYELARRDGAVSQAGY